MKKDRYRALTHAFNSLARANGVIVEMKKARYRALTHLFHFLILRQTYRRNEESPIQGIDTVFNFSFENRIINVEMKKARYRALTPFLTSFKIEDSK